LAFSPSTFAAFTILLLGLDQPEPLIYNLEAIIAFAGWIYLLIMPGFGFRRRCG
jgi:hypothetical protein